MEGEEWKEMERGGNLHDWGNGMKKVGMGKTQNRNEMVTERTRRTGLKR